MLEHSPTQLDTQFDLTDLGDVGDVAPRTNGHTATLAPVSAEPTAPAASTVEGDAAWLPPDFYGYRWEPLAAARPTGRRTVQLTWEDGTQLECHVLWLRENAPGEGGIHPVTRETTLDAADLPANLHVGSCGVVEGGLELTFEPEHRNARYHPGWLYHIACGRHQVLGGLPEPKPWTTASLPRPVEVDGTAVATDADALADALLAVARDGVVLLTGCGSDDHTVEQMAKRVGRARDNQFGKIFTVDINPAADSLAYTAERLPPHTDLPTWEDPPGAQLLHCTQNTVVGGEFTLTDGLAVLEHLREHRPEVVDALTTLPWIFFNKTPSYDMRSCRPMVERRNSATGWVFRCGHLRAFPAMDVADIDRAYEAMNAFGAAAVHPDLQMRHQFRAGDMMVFDNRRIMHGRDSFTATPTDRRRLRGTYVEIDDIYSTLRLVLRARAGEAPDIEQRLAARL